MTYSDLKSKLSAIEYEIRLAEEFRDNLPELHELKQAYEQRLIEVETEMQMAPQVAA